MKISNDLGKKQKFFVENIKSLADKMLKPRAEETDMSRDFPRDLLNQLAENRLLGLIVPKAMGGEGAEFFDFFLMLEGIAKICPTSALMCSVQNLGAWFLSVWGTNVQKEKYLSAVIDGKLIFGYGLPEAVSFDLVATPFSFSKGYSIQDGFVLEGPEVHMINGDAANLCVVFAKSEQSPSGFLVETDTPGFNGWSKEGLVGAEARYACKVRLESCHIPIENLVGEEGQADEIMRDLFFKECCFVAARALGIAQGSLEFALQYSQEREQFGRTISQFPAIQMLLGDMGARIEAARHLGYKAASALDQKSSSAQMLTSMAKYFAADAAFKVAKDALQISGGYGLMKDYPVEKMMRNSQLAQISQGSSHNQRLIIAKELLK
jgi:butyryl-CoA dehydrogenase